MYTENEIVQCLGCEVISFRVGFSNDEDIDNITGKWIRSETLFPKREGNRAKIAQPHWDFPQELFNIYNETDLAIDNKLRVLSGVGMRAILETVCKDQKAEGKNFFKQIDGLVKIGVLTEDGAKTLHKVRLLGNASAHDEPQPQEQLDLAWDVIVNLLYNIYILPARAEVVFKK